MERLGINFRPYTLIRALLAVAATSIVTIPKFTKTGIPTYSTYQGINLACYPSFPIQHPKKISEIQSILNQAISLNTTVKAFGSRHSLTEIICTNGIPIDMKNIDHVNVNLKEDTVTVGGGTELHKLLETLHLFNRTLITIPSYAGITVGGALGTGSHGSSLKHPTTISDQVVSMVIVDGTARVRSITNPEDLKAFRVHLGLLGIVYEVTLRTVPQFKLHTVNYPVSDDVLETDEILELASSHDFFQFWWFPTSSSVVLSRGNIVPTDTPGNARINLIPKFSRAFALTSKHQLEASAESGDRVIPEIMQEVTRLSLFDVNIPLPNPIFTEDGVHMKNPAIGYGYKMMSSICSGICPWDHGPEVSIFVDESSVSIDLGEFYNVIKTLKEIFDVAPMEFPIFGMLFRFSPPSDAMLSMQQGKKTLHIDWVTPLRFDPWTKPKAGIATIQAIQQALVLKHGGRPHWGKNGRFYHTSEVLRKPFGNNLKSFYEYMRKYDPNRVFLNNFGNRLYGKNARSSKSIKGQPCALQDYCVCKKDEDCSSNSQMKCGYLTEFRVCKNRFT